MDNILMPGSNWKSKDLSLTRDIFNLIYLFIALLGLCCCTQTFSGCSEHGSSLVVHRLLVAVASLEECGL